MQYKLKVAGFTDDQIILEDESKNIIYWPKDKLPQIPELGQTINFNVGDEAINPDPKTLLNELLNIEKS